MNFSELTYETEYPLGLSPGLFGMILTIWEIITIIFWLLFSLQGEGNLDIALLVGCVPILFPFVYEYFRFKKFGWIIGALEKVVSSAGLTKEVVPKHRTIFGYNAVEHGPIFKAYQAGENKFMLIFLPNGCPNATIDLLPFLQAELPQYTVALTERLPKKYLIIKKSYGKSLTNENYN
ncbi:hypothetical protein [Lactobacillus sp. ESL0681]|uniref:hypothetical protein n=1 Tax=Lactobacillus sp. ESL0681 TaxID=2983211 RepID=UPI0023F6DE9B|nr:hypothetical protein [Lactobacillus sp. ESL0681]WEV39790.1 hypothetical protein OZX59_06155 [Lactobacillus sp. ESL0681]